MMGEAGRRQEADLNQAWDVKLQTPDQPKLEVAGVKAICPEGTGEPQQGVNQGGKVPTFEPSREGEMKTSSPGGQRTGSAKNKPQRQQ